MTEATGSTVAVTVENMVPEGPLHPLLAAAGEARDAAVSIMAGAAEAAEAAAAAETLDADTAADAAARTLVAIVKAFRKGEKAHKVGLLEAGRLEKDYIRQRMSPPLKASRAVAVKAIEGALAAYASETVDVSRHIRTYEAYRVYSATVDGVAVKGADDVPYGHWREFASLLSKTSPGTPEESFAPLEGMEEECRAYVLDCIATERARPDCVSGIAEIVRRHTAANTERTKAAAEAARKEADRVAEEAAAARKQREEANRQRLAAEYEASKVDPAASPEKAEQLAAGVEAAREELLAAQREEIAATQREVLAKQKAAEDEKARKAAERAQATQLAADKRRAEKALAGQQARPASPEAKQGTNLLAIAKQGTAKDVAGMVVELISGSDAPDDVFHAVLTLLRSHPEMSKASQRACQNALVSLNATTSKAAAAV